MNTVELTAPSSWACYLINADCSGMEDDEISACDAWLKAEGVHRFNCVDCKDAGFMRWHDASRHYPFAADCSTYAFLVD